MTATIVAAVAQAQDPDRAALAQAFDGAMTCAALTALKADRAESVKAWQWGNRSFAFGMLAVRFYTEARQEPLTNEELNEALNGYVDAFEAMPAQQQAQFEKGCAGKYAVVDELCVENACPHSPQAPR